MTNIEKNPLINSGKEKIEEKIKENFLFELSKWEEKFPSIDGENELNAAQEISKLLHNWTGVLRKSSAKSYFSEHIEGVANLVGKKSMTAAYLHDVLEDTSEMYQKYTGKELKDLISKFGNNVLNIVKSLSENKDLRESHEENIDATEKKEIPVATEDKNFMKISMLKDSLRRINDLKEENEEAWEVAATVRIADIIQNLSDFDEQSESLRERNLEKAKIIFEEFNGKIGLVEKLKEKINELNSNSEKFYDEEIGHMD